MDCGKFWRALIGYPPKFLTILRQLHERSGEAQWVSIEQLPHLQRRQARMRSGPHIVLHRLQHHAP